ncbi:single-pass membrane and coiled-coil domain-containing protein 4 [Sphaeramia orbicularis]|nr:single-pass membrane and coiled-coil domain-containing protein 4 [Sphaeramia orbicularis]
MNPSYYIIKPDSYWSVCFCPRFLPTHLHLHHQGDAMRQLKGKPKKETSKDKKERKQAMQEARQQVATVVLPTLAVLVLIIVVFVYVATRPGAME